MAVAGESFGLRHPPKQGDWLVAILERDIGELRTEDSCRLAPSSGSQCQGKFKSAGSQGVEFKPTRTTQGVID